jgi:AraC family transcriptional regulator of adaptative response/methylated-DNA-[protein]-cysteine methyltransferase
MERIMNAEMTMPVAEPAKTVSYSTDTERWQAVIDRDRAADGSFYYSVATTGVYCRPSCGARQARRENVAFHATTEAAENAGFRACRRCKPDHADRQAAAVAEACRMIEGSENAPGLSALADAVGISPFHFHRIFKAATGVTPKAYADAIRARRARTALNGAATVTEAIYEAGFSSSGRFYADSTPRLGMTPTRFRKGGKGETMRFAIGQSALGSVLVAVTDKGIAAIQFGDDPEALVRGLQDQFPNAEFVGGDESFEELVARVVAGVENPAAGWDLPLDIRGTAFQQRVWQALRAIPAGETASYADIARRMGEPKAVRAVAGACAANRIAVAIPCHRVVHSDGSLSGYRWGVERKRALLDRESTT